MAQTHSFRSAIGGFNREDVVQYIEYLSSKHAAQVNQLTSEVEFLRMQLKRCEEDAAAREKADEPPVAEVEPEQPADIAAPAEPASMADAELEAYRRAERTERIARERAEQIYLQATGTLADATTHVDDAAGQLSTIAEQVKQQLELLQNAIEHSKNCLKDAASIMSAIRPE